ncbi:MAG: hypothetical protein V7723_02015 [Sneathiella sp.]|uniref:hypothetical protein n=1 Tax=Sneathiella sp. TaxID=1964365 RepID=UPI0030024DCE
MSTFSVSFLFASFFLLPAASSEEKAKNWEHEVKLYLYATAIEGDLGIRNVNVPLDVEFSDILDNLEFGTMGFYEARKDDQLSLMFDIAYLSLYNKQSPVSNNVVTVNAKAELSQLVVEALVGYKVIDFEDPDSFSGNVKVDLIGGARYNELNLSLGTAVSVLGFTSAAVRKKKVSWVDPIIGFRARFNPSEKSRLTLYGDIGGFGVGSNNTWQILASYAYLFDNNIEVTAGYRVLYMDYDEGSGADYFAYDATYSGPMIGIGYRF